MTIPFTSWGGSKINPLSAPHNSCSPNLVRLRQLLQAEFNLPYLGCHHDRNIVGGTSTSTHSYGAALDMGTTDGKCSRADRDAAIEFVLWVSEKTGLQAIHDYEYDRIWYSNRNPLHYPDGWKKQNGAGPQMGESWATWIHVEVTKTNFLDTPDYFKLFNEYKRTVNPVIVNNLVLNPADDKRVYDSRNVRNVAFTAQSRLTIPSDKAIVYLNVTCVGASPGGAICHNNDKNSIVNWVGHGDVNANTILLPVVDNRVTFFLTHSCHVILDLFGWQDK